MDTPRLIFCVILLLPLISLFNHEFSIITIQTFYDLVISHCGKPNHSSNFSNVPWQVPNEGHVIANTNERDKDSSFWRKAFIGFKNVDDPHSSKISRALSPNVSQCFPAELPPYAITSTHCCPNVPFSSQIIKDFNDFPSPNATLRIRKAAHSVDEEYIAKFEKGIVLMKSLPPNDPRSFDQQAKVHCAYCNGAYHQRHPFQHKQLDIHRSWLFFPFHRWYIFFFERIIGKLINDPYFALPFWNWDAIEGMQFPPCFTNPNSSLFHKLRSHDHMPPHVVDLFNFGSDNRVSSHQQVSHNLATMYKQMVLASTKELFMGSPYRVGDEPRPGIGSVELAPHNTVHLWTGGDHTPNREDMGTFYTAARDPIFYSHHSNVDRMWVIWKTLEGGRNDYDDDDDWLDSEFVFYDENAHAVRVKIRDCLDTRKLGYVYEDVSLQWLHVPPIWQRKKVLRQEKKSAVLNLKPIEFPLTLDSTISTILKRPKKMRSKEEKDGEEEVLVIEGIEYASDKFVKFDVHVDDDDEDKLGGPDQVEFVGSFVSMVHGHSRKTNTRFMVGISKVLEILEAEGEDDVVVTLVPKFGKGEVVVGNIKIDLVPKY